MLSPEEFELFNASYSDEKSYGLRINPLKIKSQDALPFFLSPVPWAKEGFYAVPDEKPGRHVLHEAGAYYIQEPSAMSVAALSDAKPGDIVCDLCAAPAENPPSLPVCLMETAYLYQMKFLASEPKILSQNIERLGISNAVVCNETPENMAKYFSGFL